MFLKNFKKLKSFTLIETVFSVLMIGIVMSIVITTFISFQASQKKLNTLVSAYENLRLISDLIFRSLKVAYMIEDLNQNDATSSSITFIRGDGKCVTINFQNENLYFYSTSTNPNDPYSPCRDSNNLIKLNLDYVKIKKFEIKNIGCEDFGNNFRGPRRLEIQLFAEIDLKNSTKNVEILTSVTPKTISCK